MLAPFFLVALASLLVLLACWVLHARPQDPVNRWFASYTIGMGGWTFGLGVLHAGLAPDLSSRFVFASASLLPGSFLAFTRAYPTPSRWPSRSLIRSVITVGLLFSLLSLTTPLLIHDAVVTRAGFARKSGPLYPVFVLYFLTTWLTALGVFIAKWRSARGQARAQLQYLGIGLVISGLGGISTNLLLPFLFHTSTYTWLGPFFILPLVVLVGHAIIRHRLMDLRLVIHQGLAHLLAIGLVSVLLLVLLWLILPGWRESLHLRRDTFVTGLVVLLLLSAPAQRLLRHVIGPYLYRGHLDYTATLRRAARRLSHLMRPTEVAAELRTTLSETFVPETFTMVVWSPHPDGIEALAADNPAILDLVRASASIREFLVRQPSPSVLLPGPEQPASGVLQALRDAGVELIVTLGRRGEPLGAALLGPRRSGDAYFAADLAFIEALAELTSIALENSLLYRQRVQMLEYSDRLLESLHSAVIAADVQGKITTFNPAAMSLLGFNRDIRGSTLDVLPSEVGWALALAIRGSSLPREVEGTVEHPLRGAVPVVLSTAALHDHNGQVTGALAVVTDLSAIKELERNQRRIERLGTMARFYTGIAHEIRSPLASISNFIAMLPDRFDDPEYRDTAIRLLPLEVARITRLADRLRFMAPSEGGQLSLVDLRSLLSDIVAIHSTTALARGITLTLRCPEGPLTVLGDHGQLIQLFVNLLNNALEAMPDGGAVVFEAHETDHVGTEPSVVVRVIDDGTGIDPAVRPHVFQPFFTTKPQGTGLGLSICREIAEFHHARLSLKSRIDSQGTVAEITFPSPPLEERNGAPLAGQG